MNKVKVFLYGFLDKIIYIEQFTYYDLNPKLIFYLCKALYKLK